MKGFSPPSDLTNNNVLNVTKDYNIQCKLVGNIFCFIQTHRHWYSLPINHPSMTCTKTQTHVIKLGT